MPFMFILYCSKPPKKHKRKDTGYSTASSQNLYATKASKSAKSNKRKETKPSKKSKRARSRSPFDNDIEIRKSRHGKKSDKLEKKYAKSLIFISIDKQERNFIALRDSQFLI